MASLTASLLANLPAARPFVAAIARYKPGNLAAPWGEYITMKTVVEAPAVLDMG